MDISKIKKQGELKYDPSFDLAKITNDELAKDEYKFKWLKNAGAVPKTIVDIGGNLGLFALWARELYPNARIISIEACSDTFGLLVYNTRLASIQCHNMALGDGRRLYLWKCPVHSGGNQLRRQPTADRTGIRSYRLAEIFTKVNVEPPFAMKIDIEGGELFLYRDKNAHQIMKGAMHIAIEYHSLDIPGFRVNKCEFDEWLRSIFSDTHVITGLGGDCENIRGAVYTITSKSVAK